MTWSSNAWWELHPPAVGSPWEPRLRADVVVPAYGAQPRVEAVLAALAKQTYPAGLTSVLVVDDGSEPPLDPAVPAELDVTVLRQARDGFGAGRARAAGAAAGGGDVVAFIDSDMLPDATWLEAHMRWHHAAPNAVVIGFRRHVARTDVTGVDVRAAPSVAELFAGLEYEEPEWIERFWRDTQGARVQADGVWSVASSGNISFGRRVYERSGGFDVDYWHAWGGEDNDLGYRAWVHGGLFVPERVALAWHLGLGTSQSSEAADRLLVSRFRLASRIPDRRLARRREIHFEVPLMSLTVEVQDEGAAEAIDTIASALASLGGDIGITLVVKPDHPDHELLDRILRSDSRIEFGGSLDGSHPRWRDSPIRGWSPAVAWPKAALRKIAAEVCEGASGVITVLLENGRHARFWMTRLQELHPDIPVEHLGRDYGGRVSAFTEWE